MKALRTLCLLLAAAMLCGACQRMQDLGQDFDPRLKPADQVYRQVADSRLAKDSIYDGPATNAHFEALPLSMRVRQAMVERETLAFSLSPAQARKRLADQQKAQEEALEVVLAVYVPENKWNDLAGQNPTFLAYMVGAKGQRVEPFDRRRITDRTALHEALYYFWGPWSRLYLLRFPKTAPDGAPLVMGGKSTLVMSGAPGQAKLPLRWD